MDLLNNLGAIITVLMGCLGLFLPQKASQLTGLTAVTPAGRAEFRGTLGVTFILLGLVPVVTQNDIAFLTVGLCWLGAAIGRVISIYLDQGNEAKNWIAVGFECAIAALLLVGLSVWP
ncbi:MAG: hypothetical protein CFE27_05145 [Alphaproteobacteria bacterium PA1]|nr:MAG: hypothetical protein CFE27_05145 [Alphaproteobacteria bacterium PA1]